MAVLLVAALSCPPALAGVAGEGELARGIGRVKSGDFSAAIPPLASAIQTLGADDGRKDQLAQAYLYLGIAYLELGQELEAQGKFREALRNAPKLKLSPEEFSTQVIRVFEAERQAAHSQKKRNALPLILILGGGAASAGIAAAAAGGSGGSPAPTTAGATTTTTTTPAGGGTTTTTVPGATTTTVPGATTTTTTSTTTTTTPATTTTTTMAPSCSYSASPDRSFGLLGGSGVCNVNVSPQSCSWSVEKFPSNSNWLTFNGATSGTGNGSVSYSVAALSIGSRSALIRTKQDHGAGCNVTQGSAFEARTGLALDSHLDAAGASGQIVFNGSSVAFQGPAPASHFAAARDGSNRIEAIVVAAGSKPGTWRFDLRSGYEPGSLVSLSGPPLLQTAGSIAFQVSGEPGQRFVFFFQGRAQRPDEGGDRRP